MERRCAAVAIELFLIPNKIIDGGIIGVSLILDYLTPNIWWLSFSTLVVILNIPFMYSGYKQIGKTFMLSSTFAIVALAFIETTLHTIKPFTTEPILATVFGGLILGLGVGLVIRHGGSLDGTEIMGILLTKKITILGWGICYVCELIHFCLGALCIWCRAGNVFCYDLLYCFQNN